jgi:hypothetical protein
MEDEAWRAAILQLGALVVQTITTVALVYAEPLYDRTPYNTSALSGADWVRELLEGHPERIRCKLGVHKHVFRLLVATLLNLGYEHSQHVTLEEQLSIFLYMCVTGLSVWHVGKHFQCANETISLYALKFGHKYIYY